MLSCALCAPLTPPQPPVACPTLLCVSKLVWPVGPLGDDAALPKRGTVLRRFSKQGLKASGSAPPPQCSKAKHSTAQHISSIPPHSHTHWAYHNTARRPRVLNTLADAPPPRVSAKDISNQGTQCVDPAERRARVKWTPATLAPSFISVCYFPRAGLLLWRLAVAASAWTVS